MPRGASLAPEVTGADREEDKTIRTIHETNEPPETSRAQAKRKKSVWTEIESEKEQGATEEEDVPEVELSVEEDELVEHAAQDFCDGAHSEVRGAHYAGWFAMQKTADIRKERGFQETSPHRGPILLEEKASSSAHTKLSSPLDRNRHIWMGDGCMLEASESNHRRTLQLQLDLFTQRVDRGRAESLGSACGVLPIQ